MCYKAILNLTVVSVVTEVLIVDIGYRNKESGTHWWTLSERTQSLFIYYTSREREHGCAKVKGYVRIGNEVVECWSVSLGYDHTNHCMKSFSWCNFIKYDVGLSIICCKNFGVLSYLV